MENIDFDKQEAITARFEDLRQFLGNGFCLVHEHTVNDPYFKNRVARLHQLVNRLYAATFI